MALWMSGVQVRSLFASVVCAVLLGSSTALLGLCGPFTDVAPDAFCPFVVEIFYLGITNGTTPTTFDPTADVTRLQMAAFLSRTVDRVLKRGGGRRSVAEKLWTPQNETVVALTPVGLQPLFVKFDGADLWAPSGFGANAVTRVRASDGRVLETWTGATNGNSLGLALGRVLVTGFFNPGKLYMIDPRQPAGVVTTVATDLGDTPRSIAFDGAHVFTANSGGSVSLVTPAAAPPWPAATVTTGFSVPSGMVYDGANVWVTDAAAGALLRLDGAGAILQTVSVGADPVHPVFDGANLWVPNNLDGSVTVVRASSGTVLQTLTGNGLTSPFGGAFDGERVLITNFTAGSVSLFKAADLTPLGAISVGAATGPAMATSDGAYFWIALANAGKLARF